MILRILVGWIASAVSLMVVAHLLPGFQVASFQAALIAAIVIGLINGTLGAILKFVLFPIRLLTLGIASLVINALMLMLADNFVSGFHVEGFWPAFWGAILLSIVNAVLRAILPDGNSE